MDAKDVIDLIYVFILTFFGGFFFMDFLFTEDFGRSAKSILTSLICCFSALVVIAA